MTFRAGVALPDGWVLVPEHPIERAELTVCGVYTVADLRVTQH